MLKWNQISTKSYKYIENIENIKLKMSIHMLESKSPKSSLVWELVK